MHPDSGDDELHCARSLKISKYLSGEEPVACSGCVHLALRSDIENIAKDGNVHWALRVDAIIESKLIGRQTAAL